VADRRLWRHRPADSATLRETVRALGLAADVGARVTLEPREAALLVEWLQGERGRHSGGRPDGHA
jgi:hypothetical protein